MTNAVATSTSRKQTVPHSVSVVILGTDAVLAALPATPIQLAHACIAAGFVNVIPASWGDELIAAATLRRLPEFGEGPVIHCSCPIVAHRLLSVSGDLRPVLLPLIPPPVALARYVRALAQPSRARVTYVGGCPGAADESIDIRMTPDALLSMLSERGIDIDEQPRVFETFVPADRRRFRSQPGGLPTADALWSDHGSRSLVEVAGEDLAAEIAQLVLSGRNVLIDAAVQLGCVCSGATAHARTKDAREIFASLEPPRATAPVVNENTHVDLDLPVPAAPRTPIDVMAVPSRSAPNDSTSARFSPPRGVVAVPTTRQPARISSPGIPAAGGNSPVARPADGREGKTLPRAYVARRRPSPKSTPVVPAEPLSDQAFDATRELEQEESIERMYSVELIEFEAPATTSLAPELRVTDAEEPVAFGFDAPLSPEPIAGLESAATDSSVRADLRVSRDSNETDDQLDVAIPLSHWTEPAVSQLKNAEVSSAHWSTGNGDGSTSVAPVRAMLSRFESPATADELAQPAPAPWAPLNTRHVVFMLLAVVAVAIAVSATVAVLVERKFAPRVAVPTSNEAGR